MVLNKDTLFRGKWIYGEDFDYGQEDAGYYQNHHNTILIKEFEIANFNCAKLYIAALGYYIVKINGIRVGDFELNSDWTNYSKVVYYDEYDIANHLKPGTNCLEIELGNGMYNPAPLRLFWKITICVKSWRKSEPQKSSVIWKSIHKLSFQRMSRGNMS